MGRWEDYEVWRKRREELLAKEQDGALAREARKAREAFAAAEGNGTDVEVRWGLAEDGARVAELLELNGMPPRVALEELFVVAEGRREATAAVRYRPGSRRPGLRGYRNGSLRQAFAIAKRSPDVLEHRVGGLPDGLRGIFRRG